VARSLSLPHEFHCFTDDAADYAPGIIKRPLPQDGLRGWWNKIALFKQGLFPDGARILYLDLDTVITGSLDEIAAYDGKFAMLGPFFDNVTATFAGPQSGVMGWAGGFGGHIWQTYVNTGYPDLPGGDQAFLRHVHPKPDLWQDIYPGVIVSMKGVAGIIPEKTSIVCFHGYPLVHQVYPDGWTDVSATEIVGGAKYLGGFWWPASDRDCWWVTLATVDEQLAAVLRHTPERRLCVQAGGNVGVFPVGLSRHFKQTHTFEPDPENFRCLVHNIGGRTRLTAFNAALTEPGQIGVSLETCPENIGKARVKDFGNIQAMQVDELKLDACDLIYLDIEGFEKSALLGAVDTIRAHRPTIVIEDNGLSEHYGVAQGATPQWLVDEFGYQIAAKIGRDVILIPQKDFP